MLSKVPEYAMEGTTTFPHFGWGKGMAIYGKVRDESFLD
jgi:hypothetical protein